MMSKLVCLVALITLVVLAACGDAATTVIQEKTR